jgi:hypothetical protein
MALLDLAWPHLDGGRGRFLPHVADVAGVEKLDLLGMALLGHGSGEIARHGHEAAPCGSIQ